MSILFCFPPQQRGSDQFYFRTQQLINSLKKNFSVEIIKPLAKTGGGRDKKLSFKKIIIFLLNFPYYLKRIQEARILIIFPSPFWFFWITFGKIFNKKVVIDHYTTIVFPLENAKIPNILKKITSYFDKFFYSKIDLIITHTKTMKKEISDFYGLEKEKILPIYSLVDTQLFDPQEISVKKKNELKERYHLPKNKKILFYHGEYHSFHGFPIIKKIALFSKKRNKDFIFVFVGKKGKNQKNIHFIDYINFDKLPQIISLADLWLGRFSNSKLAQRAASSCMMQAMAMEIPIITFATRENRSIIKDRENGFLVNSLNPKEIFIRIEKILKNKPLLEKVSKETRKTIKNNFSLKNWQKANLALKNL